MVVLRYLQFLFSEAEKLLLERAPRSLSAHSDLELQFLLWLWNRARIEVNLLLN